MAGAEVIAAAVSILCLIIVGYVLVGSVLVTAEIVTNAQKDVAQTLQERQRTDIKITNATIINSSHILIELQNTGQEPVKDFGHMDVKTFNKTNGYEQNSWTFVNPGILEPEETISIYARYSSLPEKVSVITSNGVSASKHL